MILIIIFVHPIAADQMQRRKARGDLETNGSHIVGVGVVVNRISLGLTHDAGVEHVAGVH